MVGAGAPRGPSRHGRRLAARHPYRPRRRGRAPPAPAGRLLQVVLEPHHPGPGPGGPRREVVRDVHRDRFPQESRAEAAGCHPAPRFSRHRKPCRGVHLRAAPRAAAEVRQPQCREDPRLEAGALHGELRELEGMPAPGRPADGDGGAGPPGDDRPGGARVPVQGCHGRYHWIHDEGRLIAGEDGRREVVGAWWDVTEAKAAQDELRRLAAAIEQAAEMVVITDAQAEILYANPAFEKITGYRQPEVLGKNPRILKSGEHDRLFYQQIWRRCPPANPGRGASSTGRRTAACTPRRRRSRRCSAPPATSSTTWPSSAT